MEWTQQIGVAASAGAALVGVGLFVVRAEIFRQVAAIRAEIAKDKLDATDRFAAKDSMQAWMREMKADMDRRFDKLDERLDRLAERGCEHG